MPQAPGLPHPASLPQPTASVDLAAAHATLSSRRLARAVNNLLIILLIVLILLLLTGGIGWLLTGILRIILIVILVIVGVAIVMRLLKR